MNAVDGFVLAFAVAVFFTLAGAIVSAAQKGPAWKFASRTYLATSTGLAVALFFFYLGVLVSNTPTP